MTLTDKTKLAVHFSSAKIEWETPLWLFDQLDAEFGINTDVCALPENAKCDHYFTPASGLCYSDLWAGRAELDAFKQPWIGTLWMNPPYGREIGAWIKRAVMASDNGATVVSLLPARTDTAWWQDYIWNDQKHCPRDGVAVRFLRGRLKFSRQENSAPFPSAVVIFSPAPPPKPL